MKKRLTALSLSAVMAFTMGGGAIHAAAAPVGHGTYTPSEGVETYKYYFAKPWGWENDSTEENNDVPGVYWWSGPDCPDDKFGHGWPGYEMDKEDGYENLWSVNAPKLAPILVFNNYVDGGSDTTSEVFLDSIQCKNEFTAYCAKDENDAYSEKFWEYMWTKAAKQLGFDVDAPGFDCFSSDVYNAFTDPQNAAKIDFSDEFGDYGKNFFLDLNDLSGLVFNYQNMVYVVDRDPDHIEYPMDKPMYDGSFYFMYGNGEYGMWPTKDMALRMEGVTQNEDGSYSGGARVDDFGTVYNSDGQIVIGNFTKKYRTNEAEPTPGKIYFEVPDNWKDFSSVRLYLYNMDDNEVMIPWGSKRGKMTDEGNGIWSFDLDAKGHSFDDNTNYYCVFLTNTEHQTYELLINNPCLGDTAYCPPDQEITAAQLDSNKIVLKAKWKNADSERFGIPLTISPSGKVTGEVVPKGKTKLGMFTDFLKDAADALDQKTIDDVAFALGFRMNDVNYAILASGRTDLDWNENDSTIKTGDVNRDGIVNGADAGILSRYASSWQGYEDKIINMTAADINNDGKVNGADAGILARYSSGWKQYEPYFT